jgi:hypothetical protein
MIKLAYKKLELLVQGGPALPDALSVITDLKRIYSKHTLIAPSNASELTDYMSERFFILLGVCVIIHPFTCSVPAVHSAAYKAPCVYDEVMHVEDEI